MRVRAVHRNARMAPRKIRPLVTMLRGLSAVDADAQLLYMPGKAAEIVRKVLASAMANAQTNHDMTGDQLKVVDIRVDEGLKMRRFRPVSRGMAHPYVKQMSHVTVVVEGEAKKTEKKKKAAIETITADTYVALGGGEELPAAEATPVESSVGETGEKTAEKVEDKSTGEAFQKNKMMQQGGNKRKDFRRKSI